jgi:hypothetical protein
MEGTPEVAHEWCSRNGQCEHRGPGGAAPDPRCEYDF